jgi:hypothetical protein
MNEKMLLSEEDRVKWLVSIELCIGIISLLSFIPSVRVGIVCLFSNPTLAKTLFGLFLFFPATFMLLVGLLFISYGIFLYFTGGEKAPENGFKVIINGTIASFITGIFVLLSDLTLLKVPFGIHLLLSYSLLLFLLYCLPVYRKRLAMPEEERIALFITLLKYIVSKEHHEEKLGDVQEQYNHSINEAINKGTPLWKVYRKTLLGGLGLIGGSLWLKAHKLVSRWMTRAK